MDKRPILIVANIVLSRIDGANIWLSNTINKYIEKNKIHLIAPNNDINSNFKNNINNSENISIYSRSKMIPQNIINEIDTLDKKFNFKFIIIRYTNLISILDDENKLLGKICLYGLEENVEAITNLHYRSKEVWVQTDALQNLFLENSPKI
jgi:UDP-glucose 4-epimerase